MPKFVGISLIPTRAFGAISVRYLILDVILVGLKHYCTRLITALHVLL